MGTKTKTKMALAAGVVAITGAGLGVAAVGASAGDDQEPTITGTALEQASDIALAETGGGRVTDTEVGDEESYYEVEVTLDDGSEVDVQLDRDFSVVGATADDGEDGDGQEPSN